jgi:integrase
MTSRTVPSGRSSEASATRKSSPVLPVTRRKSASNSCSIDPMLSGGVDAFDRLHEHVDEVVGQLTGAKGCPGRKQRRAHRLGMPTQFTRLFNLHSLALPLARLGRDIREQVCREPDRAQPLQFGDFGQDSLQSRRARVPEEIGAIIDAAATERDRLLLTTLWATGARISEVLALRPRDIHREGLVLPNLKNPGRLVKTAHLSAAHAGLPGDLLVWARENGLDYDDPLFFSRQRAANGRRKAIDRVRAWQLVKSASERAEVRVLALRATGYGAVGDPAPVHPHLFRHARVRQIVRHTHSLALVQKQAGWARLHTEYLTLSDDEAQRLMQGVPE